MKTYFESVPSVSMDRAAHYKTQSGFYDCPFIRTPRRKKKQVEAKRPKPVVRLKQPTAKEQLLKLLLA